MRETAPALFVRSGPFRHFLGPVNAELVSGGPFPCSFEGTRYQKQPPTVRKRYSVHKTGFCGTRRIFKGALNGILSHRTHLQRPAEQPTPQTVDSLLGYATHLQRCTVPKAAYCRTGCIFSARNGPRSEVSRHKKGAPRKERTSIKLYDLIISPEIWRPGRLQDVR